MTDDEFTLWCGNLSSRITEELLYELFLQAGPIKKVTLPKDAAGYPRPYAFITFKHECSVPYAAALFKTTKIFDRPLLLQPKTKPQLVPIEEPEVSSWAELNAYKQLNEANHCQAMIQTCLEPDFNMLLQMGNQMMLPLPPMQGMDFPPYLGGFVGHQSQIEDIHRGKHGHNRNQYQHPYERDRHRDYAYNESSHRDHGRSHHSNRESSSYSHHSRERRRDRRH